MKDGSYLAELLISKGYQVSKKSFDFANLNKLSTSFTKFPLNFQAVSIAFPSWVLIEI